MTTSCIHRPRIRRGMQCNCLECRTARITALEAIANQCITCSGQMATDAAGQVTCAKGEQDCPVLELWRRALTREIEPADVTPILAELVFKRIRELPRLRGIRVLIIGDEKCGGEVCSIVEKNTDATAELHILNNDSELTKALMNAAESGYDVICLLSMLSELPAGIEDAVVAALESNAILIAPSRHTRMLDVPARLPGVIPIVATGRRGRDHTGLYSAAAELVAQLASDPDVSRLESTITVGGCVFRVGHMGA